MMILMIFKYRINLAANYSISTSIMTGEWRRQREDFVKGGTKKGS